MKTRSIESQPLEIPFKMSFSHASATREKSETFITQITSSSGKIGIGESCPRSYVTGETLDSCKQFLQDHHDDILKIQNIADLRSFVSADSLWIDKSPSAWCSIELALLDLLAKEENKSVEELLNIASSEGYPKYSAVLGIASTWPFLKRVITYRAFGFSDFKLKLSGNLNTDLAALNTLNCFGISSSRIRLDGNNVWPTARHAIEYLGNIKNRFWAVEEPITANDFNGLNEIAHALNIKIILDESFLNSDSLVQVLKNKNVFVPNIRISKMGGLLRTMDILESLQNENCAWILGSHVGETSLLTRASLTVLNKFIDFPPRAVEGGFSSHLLSYDPFSPKLKLGFGARIKFNNSKNSLGWGMDFNDRGTK